MHKQQKQGISSLIAGVGVIVLLMGIFSTVLDFNLAIVIAISIFILNGAFSAYIDVNHDGTDFQYRKGLSILISGMGVIVILMSIFLDMIDFGLAIIIAVGIWIFTGALSNILGTPTNSPYHRKRYRDYRQKSTRPVQSMKDEYSKGDNVIIHGSDSLETFKYCTNCGEKVEADSVFCTNCGTSLK